MPKKYIYVIATYVLMQLSSYLVIPLEKNLDIDPIILTVSWSIATFLIALAVSCYLLRDEIRSFFQSEDKSIGQIILWSVLGFFLVIIAQNVSGLIERYVFGVTASSENTRVLVEVARQIPIFIIIISVLGPILEELVFRKAIFGSLHKRMNFFFAAIISGFLFAILHNDFSHLLTYIAAATVFAFIYVETKRIIVPIIVHMSMNTIAVIVNLSIDPEELQKMMEEVQLILFGGF
ncbi:CPBP family intramembrane metalloprotease [Gracilibacillus oryzae]|uniref:CPBP family intramembrane metalloprotease n=1 Tax=Gracilibacillus oryzae TaxID=1672701 RepID=A0A7C8KPK0_9BACI|nr:type II CAAX endopeptidase family protein [Gracilibacillus oryzae]KAB8125701.1 CPBP family intramembrane metalloprotease [Gracilibacillus oryzae]